MMIASDYNKILQVLNFLRENDYVSSGKHDLLELEILDSKLFLDELF